MSKTVSTPDSWKDVNIKTFQELKNVPDNDNKVINTIAIFTDEDSEEVRLWDNSSFSRIASALSWTNVLPAKESMRNIIEIDGVEYGFIQKLSSLNNGNWMDIEHYLQDSVGNLHKLMAIFYRPILTKTDKFYITESYDTKTSVDRAELFLEKMNIQDCYGALLFFSSIGKESIESIKEYFKREIYLSKKPILKRLLDWQRKREARSGHGSILCIDSVKAI